MEGLLLEIDQRRAYRALSDKPIGDDVIGRIMTAATYAPSAFNSQPWRFLVVRDPGNLARLHETLSGGNYWAKKAPVLVVVATKLGLDAQLNDGRDYALFASGLATENLLLQSIKEGLHAHPMAGFDPLAVKSAFDIPDEFIVITLIALGYPGSEEGLSDKHVQAEASPRTRKPETEVIAFEAWGF
jgi:nitroreductase